MEQGLRYLPCIWLALVLSQESCTPNTGLTLAAEGLSITASWALTLNY